MKRARLLLAVSLAILAPAFSLCAWDAQALLDVLPTATLVQEPWVPGDPWVQSETTELTAQAALSHTQAILEGLSVSGTLWGMADSLPSQSPMSTPSTKIDLQSRILELKLVWEAIPGTLIWDAGKKVIHPSSGFFRTPLNVISHGALGNTANLTGSAVGTWEEGWVGTDLTLLVGSFTIASFLSPRLQWSGDADRALQYVSTQQTDYQDLTRVDVRLGSADVRLLGLLSTGGPGSADPDLRFTAGAGLDTNIGDAVTVRAEVSAASSQNRVMVTSSQVQLSTSTQAVAWAPRALAGFTWTNQDQLSVMAEYYYNGLGFIGNDYAQVISYSQTLRGTSGADTDVLDQFGDFSAAQHYGFVRVSGKIDDKLTAAAWSTVNLQDFSGLTGIVLTLTYDKWTLNASLMNAWGNTDTEAGLSPLLWKADLEASLFL
ncbi:MAG TPA: hypothetical protein VMU36_03630 [Spirochaetia bacterium]|nr:hypothetical protein [Spirochaetia bacterium]